MQADPEVAVWQFIGLILIVTGVLGMFLTFVREVFRKHSGPDDPDDLEL